MKATSKKYMAEFLGIDDDETFEMLYQSYKKTLAESIVKITAAIDASSSADLHAAAHALKGCSANIGIEPIRALANDLDIAGKAGDFKKSIELFEAIKKLSTQV